MQRVVLHWVMLAIAVSASGCCGLVYPTGKQLNGWLAKELPPGSSQDQAWDFFVRRDFHVVFVSSTAAGEPQKISGVKTVGTCLLLGWDEIDAEVGLDDRGRVKSTSATQHEWWP